MAQKTKTTAAARGDFIRLRASAEFKAWLEALAIEQQMTSTDIVTQALIAYAKAKGCKPPPRR